MAPIMPEVEQRSDLDACFAKAREISASGTPGPDGPSGKRGVAIVTPGRLIMTVPCPGPESVDAAMQDGIRAIVPDDDSQAIAVIAYTDVVKQRAFNAPDKINGMIPFLGYLVGMAYCGHTVVAFEGHPSALAAGCKGADLLIVDRPMADLLRPDWVAVAARSLRKPRILVFGRDSQIVAQDPNQPWERAQGPAEPRERRWWPFG